MTYIEKLHLEAIQNDKSVRKQLCVNDFGTSKLEMIVAKKSAEITKNISIDFAQWIALNCLRFTPNYKSEDKTTWWDGGDLYNPKKENPISTKELFQEYLKSKENEIQANQQDNG